MAAAPAASLAAPQAAPPVPPQPQAASPGPGGQFRGGAEQMRTRGI